MRRRVTYRPSKGQAILGGVMGCVFVLIGLLEVIPAALVIGGFGLIFGLIWTGLSAAIAGINFYHAFGKGYMGPEIHIEDEKCGKLDDPQTRLLQLQALYDQKLITQAEYDRKRQEILKQL